MTRLLPKLWSGTLLNAFLRSGKHIHAMAEAQPIVRAKLTVGWFLTGQQGVMLNVHRGAIVKFRRYMQ